MPTGSAGPAAPPGGFRALPRRRSDCLAGRSWPHPATRVRSACHGPRVGLPRQPDRRSFFMRLLGFGVRLRVARSNRDMGEFHRLQQATDASLVQHHEKPIENAAFEIGQAPANHAVLFGIGTLANPSGHLLLLLRHELRGTPSSVWLVRQPSNPVLVIAMHPIPQRLAVHATTLCRLRSAMAFQNQR
jgi:hypothetical protein